MESPLSHLLLMKKSYLSKYPRNSAALPSDPLLGGLEPRRLLAWRCSSSTKRLYEIFNFFTFSSNLFNLIPTYLIKNIVSSHLHEIFVIYLLRDLMNINEFKITTTNDLFALFKKMDENKRV